VEKNKLKIAKRLEDERVDLDNRSITKKKKKAVRNNSAVSVFSVIDE